MVNRRGFLKYAVAASTGVVCVGCGPRLAIAQSATAPRRREITLGGRRITTVDVHAHCAVPAVLDVVKGTPLETPARRQLEGNLGFPVEAARVADMDKDGIDVQVLSINAFWYAADRDLARQFDLRVKNSPQCARISGRFLNTARCRSFGAAAEQLEHSMKDLGWWAHHRRQRRGNPRTQV
jgi:aminocarboxymuconate-semialdehyde decarboxylase